MGRQGSVYQASSCQASKLSPVFVAMPTEANSETF